MLGQGFYFHWVFLKLSNTERTQIIFRKEKLFTGDEEVLETGKAKENNRTLTYR